MKKRILIVSGFLALLVCMALVCASCDTGDPNNQSGSDDPSKGNAGGVEDTTYYVSSSSGSDDNDGSEAKPFKTIKKVNTIKLGPGSKILFKRGDVWSCWDDGKKPLTPLGRGEKGKPVIIGAYGAGSKPIIKGSGLEEAVLIEKMEYVRVENLEITNDDEKGYLGNAASKGANVRRGVYVKANNRYDYNPAGTYARTDSSGRSTTDFGAMRGVELVGLEIHDVLGFAIHSNGQGAVRPDRPGSIPSGLVAAWWYCGGIFFKNGDLDGNGGAGPLVLAGQAVGQIVDPLIENCYIYDVSCGGVYADHSPGRWEVDRHPHPGYNEYLDYSFRGLLVKDTVIRNIGGEAIQPNNAFWNYVVDGCGVYDINYDPKGYGWYACAFYAGNNSVYQNIELARCMWNGDSHGWDNDIGCWGFGVIQYNYVRDMPGAFLMNWGGENTGNSATLVRYNISVNNGRWDGMNEPGSYGQFLFLFRTDTNIYLHNNVFYNDKKTPILFDGSWLDRAAFVNNVFWTNSSDSVLDLRNWNNRPGDHQPNNRPIYFDNNAYWGGSATPIVGADYDYPTAITARWSDAHKVEGDPGFGKVSGTSEPGGKGNDDDRKKRGYEGLPHAQFYPVRDRKEIASFFKIDSSSPLYRAGREIKDQEIEDFIWGVPDRVPQGLPLPAENATPQVGNKKLIQYNSGKDFFGNDVNTAAPSIGAHEP